MRLFKYSDFINESNEDIDSICKKYNIQNYTINDDGSIDVNGNAYLNNNKLSRIPLKFRNVSGNFFCDNNNLTSLEGCPQRVGGTFDCEDNRLTTLEGCPQSVGAGFYCTDNKITDFKGFPEYYENRFSFRGNPVDEILELFNDHQKSIYWINEHDVIQGDKIILRRLEEVAHELKMELPENLTLKNYEII